MKITAQYKMVVSIPSTFGREIDTEPESYRYKLDSKFYLDEAAKKYDKLTQNSLLCESLDAIFVLACLCMAGCKTYTRTGIEAEIVISSAKYIVFRPPTADDV